MPTSRYVISMEHPVSHEMEETQVQNYDEMLDAVTEFYYPQRANKRELLQRDTGVHRLADSISAMQSLVEQGLVTIDRRHPKKERKYNPHKRGMIEVYLNFKDSSVRFVVSNREQIYESLKNQLYPMFKPTDRMFMFQLRSYLLVSDESLSEQEIIDLLESRGILIIEGLKHVPKHREKHNAQQH